VISLSRGAEWKALISEYIGTIPVNGVATAGGRRSDLCNGRYGRTWGTAAVGHNRS